MYDFLIFQTIHLFKLTLSNKLQNYLSVFCKKVKMESSKRTRVVLEKRAIRNYYDEQTKVIITGRNYKFVPKPLQYC
jgi:hypothetical protein